MASITPGRVWHVVFLGCIFVQLESHRLRREEKHEKHLILALPKAVGNEVFVGARLEVVPEGLVQHPSKPCDG